MSDFELKETELESQGTITSPNTILDDEQLKETVLFFQDEIRTAEKERTEFMENVDKWRRQREAKPTEKRKSVPWDGASNVVVPKTKSATNSICASMKASFAQKHPFFNVKANKEIHIRHAEAISKYLDVLVESKFHLNLREVLNDLFFDLVSLGTEFVSVPWVEDVMNYKRKAEGGGLEAVSVTRRKGPAVVPIRIEDFYTRSYVRDLQNAPWIAIKHRLAWHELKQRENQGIYENIDEIETYYKSKVDDATQAEDERQGFNSAEAREYEIYECWRFMDVDGDGVPEDIKVWIELDSGVVLRQDLNDLGVRHVVRIPYVSYPNRLYGEGVGSMSEHMQDAIDALFNGAINSTFISSLQMFISQRSSGIGANEKFYPLKNIVVDGDPREAVFPISFPNTAGPNMQMVNMATMYLDQTVGSNTAMQGNPDPYAKTRATASGTMFLAQQSSRIFNSVVENVEAGFAQIGALIVFQLVRNIDRADLKLLGDENEQLLREAFSVPVENLHLNFEFSISSTQVEQTEEARRQGILTLSQLYQMYGQNTLQLLTNAMAVARQVSPQAAVPYTQKYMEFTNQFLVGSQKLMEYILEFFRVDKKGYLPWLKDIEMMLEMMAVMKEQQIGGVLNGQRQMAGVGGEPRFAERGNFSGGGPMGGELPAGGASNTGQTLQEPSGQNPAL